MADREQCPDPEGGRPPGASLRQRLANGQTVLGTMVFEFNTLGLPRILADAGAEFMLIDLEHTGWGIGDIRALMTAARGERLPPVVRVHAADRSRLSMVLDAGAGGVMVAMVNDPEQAQEVAAAARFAPAGQRGVGFVYADQLAHGLSQAIDAANSETIVIVQIETRSGVEHAATIAATPGVDVVWVGEFDLSLSLGVPGDLGHNLVKEAEEEVLRVCADAGVVAGVLAADAQAARAKLKQGFRMVALGTDISLYGQALRGALGALRAPVSPPDRG